MNEDKLLEFLGSIETKIGKDNAALIKDDLGNIILENNNTLKNIDNLTRERDNYKSESEKVKAVNEKLFLQIPVGIEEPNETIEPKEQKAEEFNFRSLFDEKGKFKK